MRKKTIVFLIFISIFLSIAVAIGANKSPNLSMTLPATGERNWLTYFNNNFSILDQVYGTLLNQVPSGSLDYGTQILSEWVAKPSGIDDHANAATEGSLAYIDATAAGAQVDVRMPPGIYYIRQPLTISATTRLKPDMGAMIHTTCQVISASYKWTLSSSGTGEYYLEAAAGGQPDVGQPSVVSENLVAMTSGSLGSLTASTWGFGDNDALGYSTIYVRLVDSTDPDTKSATYVLADFSVTINSPFNPGFQVFKGFGGVTFGVGSVSEVNPKWWGATGDGTTDDTAAIQAALTAASGAAPVRFLKPSVSYLFNRLSIPSNTTILADPGATFVAKDALPDTIRGWVRMLDVENVKISGYGTTWGWATAPTDSEHWAVFDIRGAKNVLIEGTLASKAGGDGYTVGAGAVNDYSENVTLRDVRSDACRRQGISLTSGKHIRIINPIATNISGTAPAAGIDIEPNGNDDLIYDIVIENPYASGCDGNAIVIALLHLPGVVDQTVNIRIVNPSDYQCLNGLTFNKLSLAGGEKVVGRIVVENLLSSNADLSGINVWNWDSTGPRIDIVKPTVYRPNVSAFAVGKYGAAVRIWREPADTGGVKIGNVHIYEPSIIDDRATPLAYNSIYVKDLAGGGVEKVSIVDPAKIVGSVAAAVFIDGSVKVTDVHNQMLNVAASSYNQGYSNYYRTVTNGGATIGSLVTVTLLDSSPVGMADITFVNAVGPLFRIKPETTGFLSPKGTGAAKYITSYTLGDRITLRRASATEWRIVEMVGGWVPQANIWVQDTVMAVGDTRTPITANGHGYTVTAIAGDFKTHATSEPTWPLGVGMTVVDDQVTWMCIW